MSGLTQVSNNIHARNPALDFTKGILVLLMILYHWINYFISKEGDGYIYLRFITPSFIFITGFIIGNTYPRKYGCNDWKAGIRLLIRGVKILIIFTLLNIAANTFIGSTYKGQMPGLDGFIRAAPVIYGTGNTPAAFSILIPISYVILIAAILFSVGNRSTYTLRINCLTLFLCLHLVHYYGRPSANLDLIAVGLLGIVIGLSPIESVNRWVDHPYGLLLLYIGYIFAITWGGMRYGFQIVGACLSVMLIYLVGLKLQLTAPVQGQIELLGQYSLFGYIAQIGFLQLLHTGLSNLNLGPLGWWIVSFVGAVFLTLAAVNSMHTARSKSTTINKVYGLAFS